MRTCQKIHTRSATTRSLYHVCENAVETIGSLEKKIGIHIRHVDSIICLYRGLPWNQHILEDVLLSHNLLTDTAIFIYPGYEFHIVDALITNFHLPESTLLMLVSAFAGRENILRAYQHAIDESYRFFSYGDAMFIS